MQRLVRDEVPFDDLVLSKSLSASYDDESRVVQARVNSKRREREAGSEESVGGRVQYVVLNGRVKDKTTELAEDAAYARAHGLPLNRRWYLEHAIEKPSPSPASRPARRRAGVFDPARVQLGARLGVGDRCASSWRRRRLLVLLCRARPPTKVHVPRPRRSSAKE